MSCYVMLCHVTSLQFFLQPLTAYTALQHKSQQPRWMQCFQNTLDNFWWRSGHAMAWTLSSEMIARENAEKDENSIWKEDSMYPWWELRICSFGPESVKRNGTFWVPSKLKVQSTPNVTTTWVFVWHLSFSLRIIASAPQWGQPMCTKTPRWGLENVTNATPMGSEQHCIFSRTSKKP